MTYTLAAGVTVTFDLRYGYKTVTDNLGNNLIGTLTTDSDLATWHLAPDPEAPGGVNSIAVSGFYGSADSSIQILYKTRYIGI